MYKQQKNPSALRSQRMIAEALITAMTSKAYNEITVTDICEKADLVRKTFYRNFDTKEDVVQYILDDAFKAFIATLDIEHMSTREIFLDVYGFIAEQKDFLIMFYKNGLFRFAYTILVNFLTTEKLFSRLDARNIKPQFYKYMPPQIVSMVVSIIETWIESGLTDNPSELAEFTEDVMYGRLYKY
ncbi:MAG: TetR/AcrR family transcriptional regulator [Clostridiales bacterium]|jgi:AcrR family transcriptional regulator|nr:TetR/AcrR family transcriptional regulator [Clostridiales bacterium]